MAGGLIQLVAYGYQDIYLTADPNITFFKIVYRRHTNFSIQSFESTFTDNPNFGQKGRIKVTKLGDLVSRMYLRIVIDKIPTDGEKFAWVRKLGYALLKKVEIEIGGVVIDRHYNHWLNVWNQLTDNNYDAILGDVKELTEFNSKDKPSYVLYVPLQFWFNKFIGLALPLIAIQYHDVYINIELEDREKLLVKSGNFRNTHHMNIIDLGLITDYIYLDLDERKRVAEISHEYLIELVQSQEELSIIENTTRISLQMKHPTKELIWFVTNGKYTSGKRFLCYSHKDDWSDEIVNCSKQLLLDSMLLLEKGKEPMVIGNWERFLNIDDKQYSSNGNLEVINQSKLYYLWINIDSLVFNNYSITDKIEAKIRVNEFNNIIIDINVGISETDLSIPVDDMKDSRLHNHNDIYVNQFGNYGVYITGNKNSILYSSLEYNGQNRIEKRNGNFFGYLQPYMHHSKTPVDGINLYSFSFEPEKHQPTGTSNLSKIENDILTLWLDNDMVTSNMNLENRLYIFGLSYNIFRVISGLTGLFYKD